MKLPNHTALKEWSSVIDRLAAGDQIILVRKGGIADPSFGLDAPQFYLYPTYFHQGESEHRPSVTITHWCDVVRTWSVRDLDLLDKLEPLVALPRQTLEARYRFRPDQALHVIGVRTWALARPSQVVFRDEYAGCRSWVSIDEEIDVDGSLSVLNDTELAAGMAAIDSIIGDSRLEIRDSISRIPSPESRVPNS